MFVILGFAPHIDLAAGFWDTIERLADDLIALPDAGYSHMAVANLSTNEVFEADAPGVERNSLAADIEAFCNDGSGSRIYAWQFATPLTPAQEAAGQKFLDDITGEAYDFLDLARRAALKVAGYLELIVPVTTPVDLIVTAIASVDWSRALGLKAYLCYRVAADFLTAVGVAGIDGSSWGPAEAEKAEGTLFLPRVQVQELMS